MRHSISSKKVAALVAALMVLPVAVSCSVTPEETSAGVTSDISAEPETVDVDSKAPDSKVTDSKSPGSATAEARSTDGETIIDIAMTNGSFNTLVAAIEAAGLTDTLNAVGEYTVFAPTDEAFSTLPEGTLEKLLLPENKAVLTQILSYHVVNGELAASDLETGAAVTVGGEELTILTDESGITVNKATVVQPEVYASNGVVHAIDAVLVPPTLDLSAL